MLLDYGISDTSLKKLIEIYQPTYVFIPKKRFNNLNNFKLKKIYEEYVLLEQETKCAKKLNDALALLLPTSGSTGSPKLVRLSFENIASNSKSIIQYLKLNELDRAITSLPFTYSYGLSVINSHLAVGATLVLTNSSLIESKFWKLLSEYGVTSMAGVPFSYKMLLRLKFEEMNLPSLRLLTQAGGKMPIEDLTKITSICAIKKIDFYTMYGQTEASPRIAYLEPAQLSSRLGSIGKAIPSGELWLENKNGVRINESNVKGELVYKGKNVALGYATCEKDLGLADEWGGILHTGDLAYQDSDGYFYIIGRKSAFIKVNGLRIGLDSVESWFREKNVSIAALGGDDQLVIVIEDTNLVLDHKLAELFIRSIGVHRSKINFKVMDKLPRFSNGKINYVLLKEMLNLERESR